MVVDNGGCASLIFCFVRNSLMKWWATSDLSPLVAGESAAAGFFLTDEPAPTRWRSTVVNGTWFKTARRRRGATWSVTFNGYRWICPRWTKHRISIYRDPRGTSRSVWPARVLSAVDLLSSSGEDRGNLTKFKGFLRNLYLLFSHYEIFGGSRFTAMKNGEKDIDQCHI